MKQMKEKKKGREEVREIFEEAAIVPCDACIMSVTRED